MELLQNQDLKRLKPQGRVGLARHNIYICDTLQYFQGLSPHVAKEFCSKRDEVSAAKMASGEKHTGSGSTIFSKILDKSIKADIVHEDDKVNIHSSRVE